MLDPPVSLFPLLLLASLLILPHLSSSATAERIRIGESAKRSSPPGMVNINRLLLENPLLQNMPMFSSSTLASSETKIFKKKVKSTESSTSIWPANLRRNKYKPEDDNFDAEYMKMNASLFDRAVIEDLDIKNGSMSKPSTLKPLPTGRSLADIEDEMETDTRMISTTRAMNNEITEDNPPFAVTQSLITALSTASMNTASTQPTTILETIPTTDADEILMTMTTPQTRTTKPKGLSHATFTGTTYGSIPSRDESTTFGASTTPFDRDDENRVEVDHDHYIVAGTKIYVDSRIDGAHITREDNPFEEDPPSDPFAIEREFRKSRKVHGTRNRRVNAAKGLPGIKRTRGFVKSVMIRKIGEDIDMPSNAKMIKNGNGKMVERRETMRAGKKITVVLSNPALYGHDLIAKPGSVVNGKIVDENGILRTKTGGKASKSHAVRTEIRSPHSPDETLVPFIQNSILIDSDKNELVLPPLTTDDELNEELLEEMRRAQVLEGDTERIDMQVTPMKTTAEKLAESCFAARRHTLLVGVDSIERKTGVSHLDCLRLCSDSSKDCQSIVYHDIFSVCDMFDARDGVGKAELLPATGKYYYEPIKEVKNCMDTFFRRLHAASTTSSSSRPKTEDSRLKLVEKDRDKLKMIHVDTAIAGKPRRRNFAASASCSAGEEPLFARSQAMRNPYPLQSDLVLRLNEDDCVFVCLTNSTLDSKEVSCATVQFDAFMQQCILSPSPTAHPLTRSISSNFYEKLCVSMSSARLCSGGTVDRRSQYILLGFLRDARTMPSPAACLDTCITASTNLGFQCYSVMYYYEEEKLNCILNDASAVTQPTALKKEDEIAVDYFGVDECFGMKEAESNVLAKTSSQLAVATSFRGGQLRRMLKLRKKAMRIRRMLRR